MSFKLGPKYLILDVSIYPFDPTCDIYPNKVKNAVDHVNMGTDALQTAKSLQKKSRKCLMIGIILVLVIAIILVLSILKPWRK
ncbi:hypothetical protein CDL12_29963 [Handroanthus impetiginosus]|uniref:t-SNARE coiled-coil homology domain-containing protein n=1 Tax=Handroanthus impetiginosus TaxID=429701 RepID=A0A2G9FWX2_9LAMI|nr:hypothetical protein CDL12_29963 [Handroanthus impetiginosus]